MTRVSMTLEQVHQLAKSALMASGADTANATAVADTVTAAERDGAESHGLFRIPGYIAALRNGKVLGDTVPEVVDHAPGVVVVDGKGGYAPLALAAGRPMLIEKALSAGVAVMALRNMHHFAALWPETEALAQEGLCAFACTAAMPYVAPAGGREALFGTNPVAFAWPRPDKQPMVIDMATSMTARGEIMVAARDGHSVPLGAGLDADGNETTDPNAILNGGVQLPFGGYKGSALAMMVELLAAGLVGDFFSFEAKEDGAGREGPPKGGEFILALNPEKIAGQGWAGHAEGFFARLEAMEGVRLPGDRRYVNRDRTPTDGVAVNADLKTKIEELAGI